MPPRQPSPSQVSRALARAIVRMQCTRAMRTSTPSSSSTISLPVDSHSARYTVYKTIADGLVKTGAIVPSLVEPAAMCLAHSPQMACEWAELHHHIKWTSGNWSGLHFYWKFHK